jgi:SAM-dependent methyltransferase
VGAVVLAEISEGQDGTEIVSVLRSWKVKALAQRIFSGMPATDRVYRSIQRSVGRLRSPNPQPYVDASTAILEAIGDEGIGGLHTMEIGTGWNLNLPIALYLLGAGPCTTIDANRHCTRAEAQRSADALVDALRTAFRDDAEVVAAIDERWRAFKAGPWDDSIRRAGITYRAPGDARDSGLASRTCDLVFSRATLQHIPPEVLRGVFAETARVLRPGGSFWHRLGLCDQFSLFDPSISRIHYLRYSDEEWERIAGNRYAYANRLRLSDFVQLAEDAGFVVEVIRRRVDDKAIADARTAGVHPDFAGRTDEDIGTVSADLLGKLPG